MFIVFPKQTRKEIILKKTFSLKTLADRKLINQVQKSHWGGVEWVEGGEGVGGEGYCQPVS